jgi:TolB protein
LTLSRDGNPDVYVLGLQDRTLRRITDNVAIDTEPTWSPDGRTLVFTSDRGGRPQLYKSPVTGGRAQRLTFEGDYNAGAAFSPDGQHLAMVHGQGGRYRIAVLDLGSGLLRVVSDGTLDESPSFAPNGSMIIYATQFEGRGVLAAVSVDGRVRQRLMLHEGDVREPAWSPLR